MVYYEIEYKTNEMANWLVSVSQEELCEMGSKGEKIIKDKYTRDIVTKQYVKLIDGLLKSN